MITPGAMLKVAVSSVAGKAWKHKKSIGLVGAGLISLPLARAVYSSVASPSYSGFRASEVVEGDLIDYKENFSGSKAKMVVQRGGYVWELYDDEDGTSVNSRESFDSDSLERVIIKPARKSEMPDGRKSWNFDKDIIGNGTIDGEKAAEALKKGTEYFIWGEKKIRQDYESGINDVLESLSVPELKDPHFVGPRER